MVPHDGTEMSDKALDKAAELAKALHSEILIVHIVDSRFVPPSTTLGFISDKPSLEDAKSQLIKILRTGAQTMLEHNIEKIKAQGIPVRFQLGVGSPATEIVSMAKQQAAGLIVIGSRQIGKQPGTRGRVAREVSEHSSCPVMIVRYAHSNCSL